MFYWVPSAHQHLSRELALLDVTIKRNHATR